MIIIVCVFVCVCVWGVLAFGVILLKIRLLQLFFTSSLLFYVGKGNCFA